MYEGWKKRGALSSEWVAKTDAFLNHAFARSETGTDVRCPCSKCQNINLGVLYQVVGILGMGILGLVEIPQLGLELLELRERGSCILLDHLQSFHPNLGF
jgi:hypothetical protein